jgi:hypothetical protein
MPVEIGRMLEDECKKYEDLTFMVEPDYLSYAIIQRKFTLDNYVVMETQYKASQPDEVFETPFHLTDARGIGALKPYDGKAYFNTAEDWEGQYKDFRDSKNNLKSKEVKNVLYDF